MATTDIISYYVNLLILQYLQKPKASAMVGTTVTPVLLPDSNVQSLVFSGVPASGSFHLHYAASNITVTWNESASSIETALQAILPSPLVVSVDGSVAAGLTFTITSNVDAVEFLSVSNNSIVDAGSNSLIPYLNEIGNQLPFDIQNGFNLIGPDFAVGAQLDILGKYVGVKRSGLGFTDNIVLDDANFLKLINMAIVLNNASSSLATVQLFLNQYFPGEIYVFDYENMYISYLIDSNTIDEDLIELFVTQGLLPKPMGVGLSVVAAPIIDKFFAFRTAFAPAWPKTTGIQTVANYHTDWLWLTAADGVGI